MTTKAARQILVILCCAVGASHAVAQGHAVIDNPASTHVSQARAVAVQLQPTSGPAGSSEAAQDAARTFMSLSTGVAKDQVTTTLESAEGNEATVLVSTPTPNVYGSKCRYWFVKNAELNAFGWEMKSKACS